MAQTTLQPADETCSADATDVTGLVTNQALGGFPAVSATNVRLRLLNDTTGLTVSASTSGAGTASAIARLEYSTNNGSSWSIAVAVPATRSSPPSGAGTTNNSASAPYADVNVGDVADMSKFRIRAYADGSATGDGSAVAHADCTDWEVLFEAAGGGILEA